MTRALDRLLTEIRACRLCEAHLPLGPRPVVQAGAGARLMIVGQAPGTKVHASGIPFNDPSGDRLRAWLGVDRDTFYDRERIALVPTGFCYPGKGGGGDLPPRPECAPAWQAKVRRHLPNVRLTLLVGRYALAHYLGDRRKATLTATARAYEDYLPAFWPTPHPSPRNLLWLRRNPWFEAEAVPALQARVGTLLGEPG
ncbi:MAG: uracil-DNA glycosylase family protein [Alphaproteobacteria bacterium]|nr:uracil-DNA glycosylase family protein [Alphaproteobacteria bacterium]